MAEQVNEPEDDSEDVDEGPIVLPDGATCATCAYAHMRDVEVPGKIQGSTVKVPRRFCLRYPPSPVLIPMGGQNAGIVSQHPAVDDSDICYEYDIAPVGLLNG